MHILYEKSIKDVNNNKDSLSPSTSTIIPINNGINKIIFGRKTIEFNNWYYIDSRCSSDIIWRDNMLGKSELA